MTIMPGLGLTPFAVDVHASQAGTLGRAISAVHSGLVDEAIAIDEDAVVVAQPGRQRNIRVVAKGNA